jgi:hypothetical protein
MRTTAILIVAAFLLVLSVGCYSRVSDVTAVSTKSVMVPGERLGEVEGVEKAHIYCIFPDKQLNVKEAIDKALESKKADMLIDVKFYVKGWYIPFIYGEVSVKVKGTAVRMMPEAVKPAPPAPTAPPIK